MSANQQPTSLLFYRQISVLNPERHAGLRLGTAPNQGFAAHTNSVPLVALEFIESCREYPIIFTRAETNTFSPIALLGLENGENLFIDDELLWKAHYVPAFVRRYPFVLGENPENPSQPWVCVDQTCDWLGSESGEPLFVGDQPSELLKQTMAFLTDYNVQSQRTAEFCRKLGEWGLLKETQARATTTADGKSYTLNGLWVVDESALACLPSEQMQELFKTGELAWIYFHLASLGNLGRLVERKAAKAMANVQLH